MILVTLATMVGYFFTKENDLIGDFCLALLGSSAIATFLELVNYFTAKRQLILQIISDNNVISNYIHDALWIYNISTDAKKKLDTFFELYEKCNTFVFSLSKEVYEPFYSKEKLTNTVAENSDAIVDILEILLKGHRKIALSREARNQLIYIKGDKEMGDKILDEQLVAVINQYIYPLKKNECIIAECNMKYKTAYKLLDSSKIKTHDEVIDEVVNELTSELSTDNNIQRAEQSS